MRSTSRAVIVYGDRKFVVCVVVELEPSNVTNRCYFYSNGEIRGSCYTVRGVGRDYRFRQRQQRAGE